MIERNGDNMGKKLPVLTEEEQEEKKLEYYQTVSAFAGKSISELMGNEKCYNNYNDNDCESKRIILQNLTAPSTSRQLWEIVKCNGYIGEYKTFTSLLVRYQNPKYGYIKKLTTEKPIMYELTEYGRLNAKNPKMLREEGIKRYREYRKKELRDIILNDSERFKEIYESIFGENSFNNFTSFIAYSNQSKDNSFGGNRDAKIEEMREKIENDGFLQDLNLDKIEELVKLGDADLLTDFYINLNDYHKRQKSPMILQKEYAPSKPEGLRDYYTVLVKATNHLVSKSTYEKIPFRFISVGNKQELRLKSTSEAGVYRNNKDAVELGFEHVNSKYFYNRISIIMRFNSQKREYVFYYAVVDGKGNCGFTFPITTISYDDYEKVQKQIQGEMKLKLIPQK